MEIDSLTTTANSNALFDYILVDCSDICQDHFELYDYEDYLGIAHQLIAEELGYETF